MFRPAGHPRSRCDSAGDLVPAVFRLLHFRRTPLSEDHYTRAGHRIGPGSDTGTAGRTILYDWEFSVGCDGGEEDKWLNLRNFRQLRSVSLGRPKISPVSWK